MQALSCKAASHCAWCLLLEPSTLSAEGGTPIETDGKNPEPTDTEPLQVVVAEEPSPPDNGLNQPQAVGFGVKVQAESGNSAVKEEGSSSPPPSGKYTY